jgi:hypothetical protein
MEKDILIFDNSITLHNRKIENDGMLPNRVGYRIQFDYDKLAPDYTPFYQDQFNMQRQERMEIMKLATEGIEHV